MRFISKDSYQLLNRYAYADGNPIMNEDPSGHISSSLANILEITAPIALSIIPELGFGIYQAGKAYFLDFSNINLEEVFEGAASMGGGPNSRQTFMEEVERQGLKFEGKKVLTEDEACTYFNIAERAGSGSCCNAGAFLLSVSSKVGISLPVSFEEIMQALFAGQMEDNGMRSNSFIGFFHSRYPPNTITAIYQDQWKQKKPRFFEFINQYYKEHPNGFKLLLNLKDPSPGARFGHSVFFSFGEYSDMAEFSNYNNHSLKMEDYVFDSKLEDYIFDSDLVEQEWYSGLVANWLNKYLVHGVIVFTN